MVPGKVIEAINKAIEPFLANDNQSFFLAPFKSYHNFRLKIFAPCSEAFDDQGNDGDFVKVVKWFSDFWLFVDIIFIDTTGVNFADPNTVKITLSIFQGDENDNHKNQLFRAEWDDFDDQSNAHPQPHWHLIQNNKSIENTVRSFIDYIPAHRDIFEEVLVDEKNKIIDLKDFHFAMQGEWSNRGSHVHYIKDENQISAWFGGLLGYLKTELEFILKKS